MRGRLPLQFALLLGAASCLLAQNGAFKDNYGLALRTQAFTEALARKDMRTMYRMFTPAFREEVPFARFDSAASAWYGSGTVAKARRKVVDIKGVSGYVSTWVVFNGEKDYRYLYQSWLKDGDVWELAWITRLLDQSFQYGRQDTSDLAAAAAAAIGYVLSPTGRACFRPPLPRADTAVLVRSGLPEERDFKLTGMTVVWVTSRDVADNPGVPKVPFYLRLAQVRVFGDLAEAAIDVLPSEYGLAIRRRGIKVFVERGRAGWKFHSIGKIW